MEKIQSELLSRSIEWAFNCPVNPSEGGVWERMVQCEAENDVNSRPLTHIPVDAEQEAPLTPNDLLKGVANLPDTPGLD
ncbi:GD11938 [Drosophila simulans]|uniref:GD11938 n=1 Tax=Drosophila simulans TaxID=7240 RepID=B4NTJ0_DROSI|nr:GD11938 [Drosophila simulans]